MGSTGTGRRSRGRESVKLKSGRRMKEEVDHSSIRFAESRRAHCEHGEVPAPGVVEVPGCLDFVESARHRGFVDAVTGQHPKGCRSRQGAREANFVHIMSLTPS